MRKQKMNCNIFKMKKIVFIIVFIFSNINSFSQKYRFETTDVSLSINEKGKWSAYAPFKEAKIIIVFDQNKDRITVYSEILQFFKILKFKEEAKTKEAEIVTFECLNQENEACIISIYTYKKGNIKNRLYLNFKDRILVYNMKYVTEKNK